VANGKIIYTVGTDRRSEDDFIEILLSYGIQVYLDIRSIPASRIPAYRKRDLADLLAASGIEYHFRGKELGELRRGGYEAYTHTGEFLAGLARVEEIAEDRTTVLGCRERLPWKCHRKWISRELHRKGWTVEHIIDKGKLWIPK
jgi:uncharacterized protein (DUF488 family)